MTVTVGANGLSVAHKGSNGISIATLPDVCKTPSPGGPVPMPYPNISRSDSLDDGSKTVTADGGNMIAIKGSKYSMSSGDEPGTLGGVESNTFQKESTWITYSFDIMVEGENVCRLTDKKFQNHKNTVDLAGNIQSPVAPGVIVLECDSTWTECQKKQMQAKADAMDASAKKKIAQTGKGLQTRPVDKPLGLAKASWQKKYALDWNKANPEGWHDPAADPSKQASQFYDDCAKTTNPQAAKMQADHVLEVQLGGRVMGPFRWLDEAVNRKSGRQIQDARKNGEFEVTGITTKNC